MKITKRFQKFARYTRSLRIYAIIALYRVSLIGPLQPVIHVIQNRHAGKQRKHWGKTNKELILFKMVKKNKAPVYQFIVLALPTFTSWTLRSNWLIDDTWSSRESALFFLLHLSPACRALREMPRSPRLAHEEPVMKARVGSLLSRKRALLLGLALYGFGTQKLINQEIFGFISNTCVVLVLCLRCQRCRIGLPQTTRQFAVKAISCEIILFIDFIIFPKSKSNILLYLVTVLPCLKNSSLNLIAYKQSSHELFCR